MSGESCLLSTSSTEAAGGLLPSSSVPVPLVDSNLHASMDVEESVFNSTRSDHGTAGEKRGRQDEGDSGPSPARTRILEGGESEDDTSFAGAVPSKGSPKCYTVVSGEPGDQGRPDLSAIEYFRVLNFPNGEPALLDCGEQVAARCKSNLSCSLRRRVAASAASVLAAVTGCFGSGVNAVQLPTGIHEYMCVGGSGKTLEHRVGYLGISSRAGNSLPLDGSMPVLPGWQNKLLYRTEPASIIYSGCQRVGV